MPIAEGADRKGLKTSRGGGVMLVEIMIVVAITALLAAIAIPNFVTTNSTVAKGR